MQMNPDNLPLPLIQELYESRAAPAVFVAAPITSQHAQQATQPAFSSQPDHTKIRAAAPAPLQHGAEPLSSHYPTSQAVTHVQPQAPMGGPDSPTVHKSAESIIAREPSRAIAKATAKRRAKGTSGDNNGVVDEDVELAPEEMGFAGHSDDAFAGTLFRFTHSSLSFVSVCAY